MRCPSCAHPMTRAGVSRTGDSVWACTTTRYTYDKARTIQTPCIPDGRFFVGTNLERTFTADVAFAKRTAKGNVILPRADDAYDMGEAPQTEFARQYAARLARLDDLPHAIGFHGLDIDPLTKQPRPGARPVARPVPPYIRANGRRLIEAWAAAYRRGRHAVYQMSAFMLNAA